MDKRNTLLNEDFFPIVEKRVNDIMLDWCYYTIPNDFDDYPLNVFFELYEINGEYLSFNISAEEAYIRFAILLIKENLISAIKYPKILDAHDLNRSMSNHAKREEERRKKDYEKIEQELEKYRNEREQLNKEEQEKREKKLEEQERRKKELEEQERIKKEIWERFFNSPIEIDTPEEDEPDIRGPIL